MSKKGKILVASKKMSDPNFMESVVLIIKEKKNNSLGLVINNMLEGSSVEKTWADIGNEIKPSSDKPMCSGGPKYGPLMALHNLKETAEEEITEGVYWSSERNNLNKTITQADFFQIYNGYAGWGEDQLDYEINRGMWYLLPATADLVFAEPDAIWGMAKDKIQQDFCDKLNIKNTTKQVLLN